MLLKFTNACELDGKRLMEVYAEGNEENAAYFYPEEAERDRQAAVRKVEAGFLEFLNDKFFHQPEATYWIWEEDGLWVSALRTCAVSPRLYYLEALETRPEQRRKGCAGKLLAGVVEALKEEGAFRLCDCVGKRNEASLKTHQACGFQIVAEAGYDYLNKQVNERCFGLEYSFPGA